MVIESPEQASGFGLAVVLVLAMLDDDCARGSDSCSVPDHRPIEHTRGCDAPLPSFH
jgi:hypothetical protein